MPRTRTSRRSRSVSRTRGRVVPDIKKLPIQDDEPLSTENNNNNDDSLLREQIDSLKSEIATLNNIRSKLTEKIKSLEDQLNKQPSEGKDTCTFVFTDNMELMQDMANKNKSFKYDKLIMIV